MIFNIGLISAIQQHKLPIGIHTSWRRDCSPLQSSCLENPMTVGPGRLLSTGSQRVRMTERHHCTSLRTYATSLSSLPPAPTLLYPSRLLQSLSSSCLSPTANFHCLSILCIVVLCFHAPLSIHLTFSFLSPALVHMSVFCVCFSIAALQIALSVPSF